MTPDNHSAHGADSMDFERSFRRLQEVVRRLSEGNLSLQEALTAFEEGMELADRCARMLDAAELRVRQVSERAMRSGSAALAEIEAAIRDSTDRDSRPEHELVSFEVEESYETTVFLKRPDSTDESDGQGGQRRAGHGHENGPSSRRAGGLFPRSRHDSTDSTNSTNNAGNLPRYDADPLFDEDEDE
jgi:exodeoxyribonuclease VII small subunit